MLKCSTAKNNQSIHGILVRRIFVFCVHLGLQKLRSQLDVGPGFFEFFDFPEGEKRHKVSAELMRERNPLALLLIRKH
jgi:hypothetical protein